jgi:hypothetical protein
MSSQLVQGDVDAETADTSGLCCVKRKEKEGGTAGRRRSSRHASLSVAEEARALEAKLSPRDSFLQI